MIVRFLEGSDGSKVFRDFYDSQLETPCNMDPQLVPMRCVPPSSNLQLRYSNDGCTNRLLTTLPSASGFAVLGTGQYKEVFRVGPEHTGPVFLGTPGDCSTDTSQPNLEYHLLGDEIPLASLVSFN
jgi:hypothetical protein